MLRKWAFRAELDSPPPANPPRSRGFLQGVAGAESSFAEAAVVELRPGLILGLIPRRYEASEVSALY